MDRASDDFLSDAALTRDQDLGVGTGYAIDLLLEGRNLRAATCELNV
jgi:hypothetical protein